MPLPEIRLEGRLIEGSFIQISFTIDKDLAFLRESSPYGKFLVLNCEFKEVNVNPSSQYMQNQFTQFQLRQTVYLPPQDSVVTILSLKAWIGIWNAVNNMNSFSLPSILVDFPGDNRARKGNRFDIIVQLDDHIINNIEDARNAGNVRFYIVFRGTACIHSSQIVESTLKPGAPPLTWYPSEVFSVSCNGSLIPGVGTQIEIPRDLWIQQISQIGIQRYLIELPIPSKDAYKDKWKNAIANLANTESLRRIGKFEQAIEECRKIIEALKSIIEEQWQIPQKKGGSFSDWTKELCGRLQTAWDKGHKENKERAETLTALLSAAWTWTSPWHHSSPHQISVREESSFALQLTGNLLSFASQLLESYPDLKLTAPDKNGSESGGDGK